MTDAHEQHLQRIKDAFCRDVDTKYRKGQEEHGGNLWQKPRMLENALEEILDLAVYLYTLKEQQDGTARKPYDQNQAEAVEFTCTRCRMTKVQTHYDGGLICFGCATKPDEPDY